MTWFRNLSIYSLVHSLRCARLHLGLRLFPCVVQTVQSTHPASECFETTDVSLQKDTLG